MKKFFIVYAFFLLISEFTFGQTLDAYKYVYVPTVNYTSGGSDIWNISGMLRTWFSNKGFIVINENTPVIEEIENDPCLLLTCEINHTNVISGTNNVTITLKNCKSEVVHTKTGGAMGWSLQDDYNKATKRAFEGILSMSYVFNSEKTLSKEMLKTLPILEMTGLTEDSIRKYLSENKLDPIEGIYKSYQNDQLQYYKIGIIKSGYKYKAIIIEADKAYWKQGELKALFEPSSMKGFYSVKWYMGNKTSFETFGNMDNDAILNIEFKNNKDGEKQQEKFIKMFPTTNDIVKFNKDVEKSSGSGFFINSNGIIGTNAHVIEGAANIEVTVSNEVGNFNYKAKVVLVDSKNDVALIQIDDPKFKGLNAIPYGLVENSEVGSKVFTIGYPLNDIMGSNYKVTDGIISSKSGIEDDIRYYQITVPIQPGNSGGPLFNKDGNVIGITSARLNSKSVGTQIENVNYAIKSSYLLNLYKMLPGTQKMLEISKSESKELQDLVKFLKNYVCLIRTY
jgi:S1-C subfamily serine protease